MSFKQNFIWGVASSSYQIEGAAFEDGKGRSIWDVYSHTPGKTFEGHTGDVACDHYHRYKEDIALMADLGVKAYRFSISWPRVIPNGTGEINEKGLLFYEALVDELLKHGITPYATLYHWDQPYELYKKGGWLNPESPGWFAEYAGVVAGRLGDRVKHFITFNEPQVFLGHAFVEGTQAPGYQLPRSETLLMGHHVLLAHGLASQTLRSIVPEVQIGCAFTSDAAIPVSEKDEDIEAARRVYFEMPESGNWAWNVSWWSDPIVFGRYPQDGLRLFAKDLPEITEEDMRIIHQPPDFYGQNIYRGVHVAAKGDGYEKILDPPGVPKTAIGWPVHFDCLYWGAKFLYERYQIPIFITENGISGTDWPSLDGKVHDAPRIDYLHRHLLWLERAAREGIDVGGYFTWGLLDNFEWTLGYSDRFGIVYVDYATQERLPKDSYYWYQKVIKNNGL